MSLGPRELEAIRSNARRGGYVRPNQVLQLIGDLEDVREQNKHLRGQLELADAGARSVAALTAVLARLQDHVRQLEAAALEASSRPTVRNMLLGQVKGAKVAITYITDEFHVEPEESTT